MLCDEGGELGPMRNAGKGVTHNEETRNNNLVMKCLGACYERISKVEGREIGSWCGSVRWLETTKGGLTHPAQGQYKNAPSQKEKAYRSPSRHRVGKRHEFLEIGVIANILHPSTVYVSSSHRVCIFAFSSGRLSCF